MDNVVLAVLGRGLVPLSEPVARADDLGLTRGDGIFETMHVRDGVPWLLDPHLDRLERSADTLRLALPPRDELAALVRTAAGARPAGEGGVKLVCTRGPEAGGPPTVYALSFDVGPTQVEQRRSGVRVLTATLGWSADVRTAAPWLLGGVKSLSYGINMAALRWAGEQGADDVILLAADGQVLEGPTSSVVWLTGTTLATVPADTGILAGTTARYLLDHAAALGCVAEYRRAGVPDLLAADEVWLVSSVRGAARVGTLDGKPLTAGGHTDAVLDLLGYPA